MAPGVVGVLLENVLELGLLGVEGVEGGLGVVVVLGVGGDGLDGGECELAVLFAGLSADEAGGGLRRAAEAVIVPADGLRHFLAEALLGEFEGVEEDAGGEGVGVSALGVILGAGGELAHLGDALGEGVLVGLVGEGVDDGLPVARGGLADEAEGA